MVGHWWQRPTRKVISVTHSDCHCLRCCLVNAFGRGNVCKQLNNIITPYHSSTTAGVVVSRCVYCIIMYYHSDRQVTNKSLRNLQDSKEAHNQPTLTNESEPTNLNPPTLTNQPTEPTFTNQPSPTNSPAGECSQRSRDLACEFSQGFLHIIVQEPWRLVSCLQHLQAARRESEPRGLLGIGQYMSILTIQKWVDDD